MSLFTEKAQKKRLMARDGCSEEMALKMIRSQIPVDEKKGYCDLIVDNSGTENETREQVEKLWAKLQKLRQERKGSKI